MQKLVTVFGASGFVGRHVVRALCKDGWRVRAAVRRPHLAHDLKVMGDVGQVEIVQANVRMKASIADAVVGADAVVNLVGVLWTQGANGFHAVHIDAARHIAEAATAAGATRLVHISALGADAKSPSMYARTKAEGEAAVRAAFPKATIVRPSVVFGIQDSFFNKFGLMASVSPVLPLIGGGKTRFQPVFAGDVGAAVTKILSLKDAAAVYELGGPQTYSFKELMQLVLKETQRKRTLLPIPFEAASLLGLAGDLQAAVLPFAPPVTSDQVKLLKADNVAENGLPGLKQLGIAATSVEGVVPTYLWRFRKGGQFAQAETVEA